MGRVRKSQPKRARPARQQKDLPKLIDGLTTEGFQWQSKGGTQFLTNAMCRQIIASLRLYIDAEDKVQITSQLARMFENACSVVLQDNIPDEPAIFWKTIANSVPWMKQVDGETLQLFALKVLSARITALKAKDEAKAMGLHMKAEKFGIETKLTLAVDQYANLLPAKYAFWRDLEPTPVDFDSLNTQRTILPDIYLPWWVEDDNNQGSEEATIEYKKLLNTMGGSLTISGSSQHQEQGEGDDDDHVDMESDEMDMDEQPSQEADEDYDYEEYEEYLENDADYKWHD